MANNRVIKRTIFGMALAVGLFTAIIIPAIYFLTAYNGLSNHLQALAQRQAILISEYLYTHDELWQYNLHSLMGLLAQGQTRLEREKQLRRIRDVKGNVIVMTNVKPKTPILTRAAKIGNGYQVLGTVEFSESMGGIWTATGYAIFLGIMTGLLIFITLSALPIHVLNETVIQLEREIAEKHHTQNMLRHAQKLESLGTLASGIAHNLNNLLLPVLALTQMTLKVLPANSAEHQRLEKVIQATLRAKDLVNRITALSRRDALKTEAVSINDVVENAMELCRSILLPTITFTKSLEADVGEVMADTGQIETIFLNVIGNAADAINPVAGKIGVELSKIEVDEALASAVPNLHVGSYAKISIIDNGHGMAPETVEHVFDPFFTTKDIGKGTGLGLSTTYGILMQYDGAVRVSSSPGTGTVFEIYLPLVAPMGRSAGPALRKEVSPATE
ncbi:MAG: ATP-binding protein [Rhodospirillales bacterium]